MVGAERIVAFRHITLDGEQTADEAQSGDVMNDGRLFSLLVRRVDADDAPIGISHFCFSVLLPGPNRVSMPLQGDPFAITRHFVRALSE